VGIRLNSGFPFFVVAIWLQKLLEKIKLRRISGILPQDLDLKARYRANIKYRD
jgi:hypothetical protein